MKDELADLIAQRLNDAKEQLKKQFFLEHPIKVARHFALDNLLPADIAEQIYASFPKANEMRLLHSYGELKLKYKYVRDAEKLIQDLHLSFQDPRVIAVIEEITEIKNQLPDRSRIAGAVSTLLKGHFINPHVDSSHDVDKKFYRTTNLLYYLSPGWKLENGGNYELWDVAVKNRIIVPSLFNRLLVVETNRRSWHAVNPVVCDGQRRCMFNYYFSEQSPEGEDYFHSPASIFHNQLIRPRPEQKIRRVIARIKDAIFT